MRGLRFSEKQTRVLSWWKDDRYDGIICDGAVRSGKTFAAGLSFFLWAMARFEGKQFALCAPSVKAVRRNVLTAVRPVLEGMGFGWQEQLSRDQVVVSAGRRENVFYLYGGGDEGSAGLIQGVTLAGVLLDEAVLMPRSFVEQACARCSVAGSRVWFSCNPAGPEHWFYREWITKAEEKRVLYLRFAMEDNPALPEKVKRRYERMFQGCFYRRFVLGEWTAAEGLVYDFFSAEMMKEAPEGLGRWRISCDYGTRNPASFGLWGEKDGVWYRVAEYYYDGRAEGRQKTDGEYVRDLRRLAEGKKIELIVADPSAASFIEALRREGWTVQKADNRVLEGIRRTALALKEGRVVVCKGCRAAGREFGLYRWEEDGSRDRVRKEHDHAMDDIRYFVMSLAEEAGGAACTVERSTRGGGVLREWQSCLRRPDFFCGKEIGAGKGIGNDPEGVPNI